MNSADMANIPPTNSSRRGGLIGWGVFLIVVGCASAIGNVNSLMNIAGIYSQPVRGGNVYYGTSGHLRAAPADIPWKDLAAILGTLAISCGIVWTGIASCIGRRWARPIALVLCGFAIAVGIFFFASLTLSLPSVINTASDAAVRYDPRSVAPTSILVAYGVRAAVILAVAVVLPYLMLRFYANPSTLRLLQSLDPRGTWVDRLPVPVLAWAILCVLATLGMLYELDLNGTPFFTIALTGLPAWLLKLPSIVLMAWGAWLCFRVERIGFVLTSTLLAFLHAATVVFFWTGGTLADLSPPVALPSHHLHAASQSPTWFVPTILTIEAAMIVLFGVYVSFTWPRSADTNASPSSTS